MSSSKLMVRVKDYVTRHPLVRGMVAYSIIWPTSSCIQQAIDGKSLSEFDFARSARFMLYGTLFVAPTLYGWMRITSAMWPVTSVRTALTKAVVEQFTYGPASMVCFFFGMSLMEFKTVGEAANEVSDKIVPTYKAAICFWPIIQTINFSMVPERNRIVFTSLCSLLWTIFLAYMKQLDVPETKGQILIEKSPPIIPHSNLLN